MDKYEIVAQVLEDNDYNIDDLAKLYCRVFHGYHAGGDGKAESTKTYYGDNSKFVLSIKMTPHKL